MILGNRYLRLTGWLTAIALAAAGEANLCHAQDGPTYHKDIMPILQKHCLSCHHKGGSAPQSMETYKEMRAWIRSSKKQVNDKLMPPWHLDPAVGKWKNDSSMTEAEMKLVSDWADAKGPEGDAATAPAAVDYKAEFKLGTPDQILSVAAPVKVPAQGNDAYAAYVLEPAFAADTWVSGIELIPGDYEVVNDMSLSIVPTAAAKSVEATAFDGIKDAANGVAVFNKGCSLVQKFPDGTGVLIPKGSNLVLLAHYKTIGEEVETQPKVGLYVSKSPAAKAIKTAAVENRSIAVPANAAGHKVSAELKLDKAVKIHNIVPRMNYLGRTVELSATTPDGKSQKLLKLDDYLFTMQSTYTPAEPIALPAGTVLKADATYDNTKDNAHNPNTTIKDAAYGPAPAGEMLSVLIQYAEE